MKTTSNKKFHKSKVVEDLKGFPSNKKNRPSGYGRPKNRPPKKKKKNAFFCIFFMFHTLGYKKNFFLKKIFFGDLNFFFISARSVPLRATGTRHFQGMKTASHKNFYKIKVVEDIKGFPSNTKNRPSGYGRPKNRPPKKKNKKVFFSLFFTFHIILNIF